MAPVAPGSGDPLHLRDELLAHATWVRDLARTLVRGGADAEDVAQEAQLAAWMRGRTVRGALGPWLAQVTRNFARRGWRESARRERRERAVARPEAVPGADEAAARLDTQRVLVEELAALDPAVRHALVRRYFDGWSSARIARETGEPAATVRWRLQRGLAELRARLDRRGGGDGIAWRLALLPVCGDLTPWIAVKEALEPLGRAVAGAGTVTGALTMKAATQALAASVIAASIGLGVWWSVGREGEPRAAAPEPAGASTMELADAPAVLEEASALPRAERESVDAAHAPAVESPPAAPAEPPPLVLEGRVVDADLRPIGGARARQLEDVSADDAERATRTAADGTFSLELVHTRLGGCALELEAAGHATRRIELTLPAEGTKYLGDLVLEPGGRVRGRVVGVNGAAIADALVAVTTPQLWGSLDQARVQGPTSTWHLRARSGPDGRFEVAGVATGPMRAWAHAEGMRWTLSAPVDVRAGEASEDIELVLEPVVRDDRITGVVLSPDGAPVAGAGISGMERSGGGGSSLALRCDDAGRFELAAKPGYVYDLAAGDPEDRWASVESEGVPPGTHDLELRFVEARHVVVRVRASDGSAPEEYRVTAISARDSYREHQRVEGSREEPVRLRAPNEPFRVQVDARGYALASQGPFEPGDAPAELAFELEPEPGLRGRVLAGGEPVAGARVRLHPVHPGSRIDHKGYPSLIVPRADDETRTDDAGAFVLSPRKRGTFVVRAEAEGYAAGDVEPFDFDPALGAEVDVVLERPGAIEGRVLVAPGRDAGGVIVALNRGDAHPRTVRSEPDGSFGFEGLTPGPWHLSRGKVEVNPSTGGTAYSGADQPTTIPFNVDVRAGETTVADLDLRDWEPCELTGTLRVNGVPAKDWTVRAWPGAAQAVVGELPTAGVAADGTFAVTLEDAGPVRLSFSPPAESGASGSIDLVTELAPGANRWEGDLALGRVSGRITTPLPDGAAVFYNTERGAKVTCWLPLRTDASGRFELPHVPTGPGAIRRYVEEGDTGRWVTLAEVDVPAGGERRVDVP